MENYSVTMYQILKAIEVASRTKSFEYDNTLDLEKLGINENELDIILKNLSDDGFIKGFIFFKGLTGFEAINPYLTTAGYLYLENNSSMKKAYSFLKEVKGWIPGFN